MAARLRPSLSRRSVLVAMAAAPLAACGHRLQRFEQRWHTFGTLVTVTLFSHRRDQAERAFSALAARFATLNRDWYAWGDGELGALNQQLKTVRTAAVSPALAQLLRDAARLGTLSGQRFNMCTGNLSQTWKLHQLQQVTPSSIPTNDAIKEALQFAQCAVSVDSQALTVSVAASGVVLDVGGIAKGAALRIADRLLREHDVSRALIDVGGDLMAVGDAGTAPFRIGLTDPRLEMPMATIALQAGEAVMSSGDYARYFEVDGRRYQHIVDPRTGMPVATRAATVIHRDPVIADVAATALVVGGAKQFSSVCDALGAHTALLIDKLGNMVKTHTMNQRLLPIKQ